mmetsp:Transcript_14010/g.58989  ORF Transcript_14010/g.58989 Transcript_14010/m.58989 type:complete len:262 (-) Transcript_14010:3458-4243(-)
MDGDGGLRRVLVPEQDHEPQAACQGTHDPGVPEAEPGVPPRRRLEPGSVPRALRATRTRRAGVRGSRVQPGRRGHRLPQPGRRAHHAEEGGGRGGVRSNEGPEPNHRAFNVGRVRERRTHRALHERQGKRDARLGRHVFLRRGGAPGHPRVRPRVRNGARHKHGLSARVGVHARVRFRNGRFFARRAGQGVAVDGGVRAAQRRAATERGGAHRRRRAGAATGRRRKRRVRAGGVVQPHHHVGTRVVSAPSVYAYEARRVFS